MQIFIIFSLLFVFSSCNVLPNPAIYLQPTENNQLDSINIENYLKNIDNIQPEVTDSPNLPTNSQNSTEISIQNTEFIQPLDLDQTDDLISPSNEELGQELAENEENFDQIEDEEVNDDDYEYLDDKLTNETEIIESEVTKGLI